MASRTQLRLGQITGSFGDVEGGIVDNLPFDTNSTIGAVNLTSGSMVGVLSEIVSAVKRIHGGATFAGAVAGEFGHAIVPDSAGGQDIGTTSLEWGDIYVADDKKIYLGSDQDFTIEYDENGDDVAQLAGANVRIGHGANTQLQFRDSAIFLNSSADGTLDIEADTQINLGTDNSGVSITIGNSTSEVTVADNLTVTGDLTVNGETVTLDVTNQSIEDAIIVLNSGSNADPANRDVGILFAKQGANSRALFVDHSDSNKVKFIITDNSGSDNEFTRNLGAAAVSVGALDATGITNSGLTDNRVVIAGTNGVLEDDANFTFDGDTLSVGSNFTVTRASGVTRAAKLEIDGANDHIDVTGGDLTVTAAANILLDAATDITLDAAGNDITFKANGTTFGAITHGSNVLTLSGGNGDAMVLDSNSGEVHFDAGGTRYATLLEDSGGFELATNQVGNNSLKLGAAGSGNSDVFAGSSGLVRFGAGGDHILNVTASAGSAQIRAGAGGVDTNDIIFTNEDFGTEIFRVDTSAHALAMPQQNAAGDDATAGLLTFNGTTDRNEAIYGDGSYLYLRSNGIALRLPDANGSAGQVLKVNAVSGNENQLVFGSAVGDLARFGFKITQTVAAGQVNFGASKTTGVSALTSYTNNLNITKAESVLDDTLEVFVNGQLLVSGASGDADRDYTFVDSDSINFAFALELDDIVQIIQR